MLSEPEDRATTVTRRVPRQVRMFSTPTQVAYSEDERNRRTILELVASDRPGLLSEVSKVLWQEGVHLHGICPPMPLYRKGKRSIAQAAYFAGKMLAIRTDCDVLDCQNFPYFSCFSVKMLSKLHGQKFFITWHEVWRDYWREYLGKKGWAGQAVELAAARLTDRNIAVSCSSSSRL